MAVALSSTAIWWCVCSPVRPIHSILRQVTQPVSLDGIPGRRADDRLRRSPRTTHTAYIVCSSALNPRGGPAPSTSRRHILYLFIACRKHLNAQHEYCTSSRLRRRRILCWPWCGHLIAALSVVIYPSLPGNSESSWHLRLRLVAARSSSVSRVAHEIRAVSLITLIETSDCNATDFFWSRFLKKNICRCHWNAIHWTRRWCSTML